MSKVVAEKHKSAFLWEDWFLVIGVIFIVMTKLRLESIPVGPGEVSMLVWALLKVRRPPLAYSIYKAKLLTMWFWLIMLLTFSIGSVINLLLFNYSTGFHNNLAYMFCFLVCFCLDRYVSKPEIISIIYNLIFTGTLIFLVLYLIGSVGILKNFLFYSNRFSGGAKNPNQLAFLMACFPFLGLEFFWEKIKNKKYIYAFLWFFLVIISLYVGLQIRSDAITGAWCITFFFTFYLSTYTSVFSKRNGLIIRIILFFVLSAVLIISYDFIFSKIVSFFNELDEGGSRAFLWSTGIETICDSYFLGLGAGSFAGYSHRSEAHNTIIDFMTQGGIIFILFFLFMLVDIFKRLRKDVFVAGAYIALVLLTMGHFVGRQPIFYVMLFFFFAYADKREYQTFV